MTGQVLTTPFAEQAHGPGDAWNVAAYLPVIAQRVPDQPAVVVTCGRGRGGRARYAELTFRQLEEQSNRYANGLTEIGIGRGMRVLVMVRPGLEFIGLIFALFKMGTVPILIDPGMGVRRMLACVRMVEPEAFVGIPVAHVVRVLRSGSFRAVRHAVTVGRRWFWGGPTLRGLGERSAGEFETVATRADETAAILFTSGSTGPPKGVVYEHGMFDAQVHAIRSHFGIEPGEVDLPALPLFALFSTAMGMTCVIPDMDPSRPAKVDPARIIEAVRDRAVTNTFGSPAIWHRVSRYCVERGIKLPTLRRILIAGAPVSPQLIERLHRVLAPSADVHTPYGATEALPVSSISGWEVLTDYHEATGWKAGPTDGRASPAGGTASPGCQCGGICVGRPLPGITLRVIQISDGPIEAWSDDLLVPNGEIGELVVRGDVVTKEYFRLEHETVLAKIHDCDGIWHRMGDVGYLDGQGRLWFCGRKAHRVTTERGTMYTVPCEAVFNRHPEVYRSALVGVGPAGRQEPVIVIEPEPGRFPSRTRVMGFWEELLELGRGNELTRLIDQVLFHPAFPVDVRHNAKIDREALAAWAAEQLR